MLAFKKVKDKLINEKEDNIPFYFTGYMESLKNNQSGTIV